MNDEERQEMLNTYRHIIDEFREGCKIREDSRDVKDAKKTKASQEDLKQANSNRKPEQEGER